MVVDSLLFNDKMTNKLIKIKNYINGKLINPIDRANLLLKLNGFETSSDNKSFDDKSVLDEIMEIRSRYTLIDFTGIFRF